MKLIRRILWQAEPGRALIEGWLVCAVMLIPILPVVLETSPLARSLYLVLVPLVSALVAGLRMRFASSPRLRSRRMTIVGAIAKEGGLALVLALLNLGLVMGLMAGLGRLDVIDDSYAGRSG